jgi:hypothetical protein
MSSQAMRESLVVGREGKLGRGRAKKLLTFRLLF